MKLREQRVDSEPKLSQTSLFKIVEINTSMIMCCRAQGAKNWAPGARSCLIL